MTASSKFSGACVVVLAIGVPLAALGQAPQAPKPGPEHKRLGYFVGKWATEGEAKPSPMGPGGKMSFTENCEWFEGNFAVVCRAEGTTPLGPTRSLGIMSYSPEHKVYTYYATDNTGMTMTSVPRGTVQGDTWTFHDEGVMGGMKMKVRVTLQELSPTAYTFRMEIEGPDGKWAPMVESKSTKK